jgi:hypothetical protein
VFCSDFAFIGNFFFSFFDQPLPGAARQPLTFFASPKKVSKERRPRFAAPSGYPLASHSNREGKQTRCAQTSFPSLSDLSTSPTATHKRNSFLARFALPWVARLRHRDFHSLPFFDRLRRTETVTSSLSPGDAQRASLEFPLASSRWRQVQIG